jgi:hypothetical protein
MMVDAINIYLVKDNDNNEVRVVVWSGNDSDLYTYSHLEGGVLNHVANKCRTVLESRSIVGKFKFKSK